MEEPVLHYVAGARARLQFDARGAAHLERAGDAGQEEPQLVFAAELLGETFRA